MSLETISSFEIGRIDEERNNGCVWDQLMQQLQPLWFYLRFQGDNAGEITAGSIQAGDKSNFDRIGSYDKGDQDHLGRSHLSHQYAPSFGD